MTMTTKTKTRKMPARYYTGAPTEVQERVAYIITLPNGSHAAGMTHEILLVERDGEGNTLGIDLGPSREGQHFVLSSVEAQNYKRAYGKRKTRWNDLPEVMKHTVTNYLKHSQKGHTTTTMTLTYSEEAKTFANSHETDYIVAQALFDRYKTPGKVAKVWQEPTDSQRDAVLEDVRALLRDTHGGGGVGHEEETPKSVMWGCERLPLT